MSRVAVVQMVSSSNVEDNINDIKRFFSDAHEVGVELIVLPENFAFMGHKEADKVAIAENYREGPIQQAISKLAKDFKLWVVAGTIPLKAASGKVKAASLVFDAEGKICARYDKIHLFDVRVSESEAHQESQTIEAGHEPVVVDTPVGKIGLSVCYDLRFPELYQLLLNKGATIFTVPSAFTAITGQAHWETLLRARAIENLCYVLAANQGGRHENGRETFGHSMIIEPWGKILGLTQQGRGLVVADIDIDKQMILRKQFPCVDHHVLNKRYSHEA